MADTDTDLEADVGLDADVDADAGLEEQAAKPSGLARLFAPVKQATWYVKQIMGDAAYDNYLERHKRIHPDHEPMTEKEFWRSRDDFNEDNVQTGCC